MYTPSFRVHNNGVPILSKKEIDAIGEKYVRDFQPEVFTDPAPVDIESFIEMYLGMTQDYQYLSHNGIYLGMTVFNDTDRVVIYSEETGRAEYISAKARTVIIDNRLLEENQRHRYRFTLGHEGGHDIFHTGYFAYNPNQFCLFDAPGQPMPPMIQCRVDSNKRDRRDPRTWNDHDRMEWQANYFSSAVLMPETAVRLAASGFDQERLQRNALNRAMLVMHIADTFDVSTESASYRLKEFGYIARDDNADYSSTGALIDFAELGGLG